MFSVPALHFPQIGRVKMGMRLAIGALRARLKSAGRANAGV